MGSQRCSCSAITCSKMLRVMSALFFLSTTTNSILSTTKRLTSAKVMYRLSTVSYRRRFGYFFITRGSLIGLLARVGRRAAGRCRFVPDHATCPWTYDPRIAQCSANANQHFSIYFLVRYAHVQAFWNPFDVPVSDGPAPGFRKGCR